MKVFIKNRDKANMTIRLQLTKAQVALLRKTLNCEHRPVQYACGMLLSRCNGWYSIVSFADQLGDAWFSSNQAMFALLRKVRSILSDVATAAPSTTVTRPVFGSTYVCVRNGKVVDGRNHKPVQQPAQTATAAQLNSLLQKFGRPQVRV